MGLWKEISKEATLLKQNYSFDLGDECKVRFWEDAWCSEAPLCLSFHTLYEVAVSKGARVANLWESLGSKGGWNFKFERSFNDWELDIVQCFICSISSKRLSPLIRDRLLWKEAKDGFFIVKSNFVFLEGRRQ